MYDDMLFSYMNAFYGTFAVTLLVSYVLLAIAGWKMFEKAGEAGWKALIPIWNTYILYKITWGTGILFLLGWIPFVGIIVQIITDYKLAKAFGHGIGYTIGLIFFPWIFALLIGFSNDQYQKL